VTERLGRALAVLFLLAVLASVVYGVVEIATGGSGAEGSSPPDSSECAPYAPGSC
jgi:hypothetical protein